MVDTKGQFAKGRALVVGVGNAYVNLLPLGRVIKNDVEKISELLSDPALCAYPRGQVEVLFDERATKANILACLKKCAAEATADDTFFFFFSGHGSTRPGENSQSYICPVDFDGSSPQETGLGTSELSALLSEIKAQRIVVILDACHSDGVVKIKSGDVLKGFAPGLRTAALEALSEGQGRVVISSCREAEVSATYGRTGHSLFSYYLLEGLRGKATGSSKVHIKIFDLFEYLAEQVPKISPIKGHVQHPVMKAHAENNFAIAMRHRGWLKSDDAYEETEASAQPAISPTKRTAQISDRDLVNAMASLYPTGPLHNSIWERAGGDVSTLALKSSGAASWFSAVKLLSNGGGGAGMSKEALVDAVRQEFPENPLFRGH